MAGLFLVNTIDVARSLGSDINAATPHSVSSFLATSYLKKRGGGFNHDPAIEATEDLFAQRKTIEEAKKYCQTTGNPKGRDQNAEIVETIGQFASSQPSKCYRTGFLAIAVGRYKGQTIFIGLKAPFTRVSDGKAFVVVPGFRKSHLPSEQQIDLILSIAAHQLARDDFSAADVEYLYAGPSPQGDSARMFRVIHGRTRKLLSTDVLDRLLTVYVEGVVKVLDLGSGLERPDLAGYRIVDPDQPSMI